ncbi:MAG: hypothetical protein EZS28_030504, partial [Streblomastix strix]
IYRQKAEEAICFTLSVFFSKEIDYEGTEL